MEVAFIGPILYYTVTGKMKRDILLNRTDSAFVKYILY